MTDKQKDSHHIKLYAGPEHACGYLKDQTSISLFADPTLPMNNAVYSELSRLGFRRSGNHVYRPKCPNCSACWTYRVITEAFKPSKSQKRILKANQHLSVGFEPAKPSLEDYELYEHYINERHKDGDMFPPSYDQYADFLFSEWCDSALIRVKDEDKTVAIMCLDLLDDGLSAVYSFFDSDKHYKGLGVFLILKTIALCQKLHLPYCYLGYYIQNCNKMNYKQSYKPGQVYKNNSWITLQIHE
ncbi:MAG: arginyltransferase [Kangiellaceae bacterium]|nr:arginyltransferase [Kangiellaceae bacterium]